MCKVHRNDDDDVFIHLLRMSSKCYNQEKIKMIYKKSKKLFTNLN